MGYFEGNVRMGEWSTMHKHPLNRILRPLILHQL
nr:MAG TPA: hypothetical protein [Crassvirales sp.]